MSLALCDKHGKFLYETMPHLFPEGRLTETELALWARLYEHRKAANG